MNKNSIALILSIIAGLLCLGRFFYTYSKTQELDYIILLAGIFIIALGISNYLRKR